MTLDRRISEGGKELWTPPQPRTPTRRRPRKVGILLALLAVGVLTQLSYLPWDPFGWDPRIEVADATWEKTPPRWRIRVLMEPEAADRLERGRLLAEFRLDGYIPLEDGTGVDRIYFPGQRGAHTDWVSARFSRVANLGEQVAGDLWAMWRLRDRKGPRPVVEHVMIVFRDADGDQVGTVCEKLFIERLWK